MLHEYLFHFNPYINLWFAFKREELVDYFNGKLENCLNSPKQKDLVDYIIKEV